MREVQCQHLIPPLVLSLMTPNPQTAEKLVELVLIIAVVVCLEHADPQALAKTTRPREEEEVRLPLDVGYVLRLVHVVIVLGHYGYEVRDSVWYAFGFAHGSLWFAFRLIWLLLAKILKYVADLAVCTA